MGSTLEFRKAFVARLKQACDEAPNVPPPHRGRQQYFSEQLKVAPEAVSKWFKAVSMPKPEKIERIAELLQVDQSWLVFGITTEMNRGERKAHGRTLDGAVYLVMGMLMLAGSHCGMPSKTDPRREYVDFYATFRGVVYPVHVAFAREMGEGVFEVIVPKEFIDVRNIAVVPAGVGKYHFLEMPSDTIDEHKIRKTGSFALEIVVAGPRYLTGGQPWPRIKSFGDLT